MRDQGPATPLRGRAVAALALAGAVVAGGLQLEREVGVRPLGSLPPSDRLSGAWFCPHGGGEGWRAWVSVANPSPEPARVALTTFGRRPPSSTEQTVDPGSLAVVEVPAEEMAAGTQVEFFDAPLVAAMTVLRPKGGVGAEPCAATASSVWYQTEGTTVRGQSQHLVLLNPFDQDVVADVTLISGDERVRHGNLQGLVVPPRRAVSFDLGRFALGKRNLSALVEVGLGRVVAAGVGLVEGGGLRLSLASDRASLLWVLPGAADDLPTELVVLAPGDEEVPFRARAQGAEVQREVLGEASVEGRSSATYELPARGVGLVAEADGRRPFVAARRLIREGVADQASTPGVAPARAWVALPAATPDGPASHLVLQNPEDEVAEVRIRFLTATGPAEAPGLAELALPPGRTRVIALADLFGDEPVAALVEASRGRVVAAQVVASESVYALAVGARPPRSG